MASVVRGRMLALVISGHIFRSLVHHSQFSTLRDSNSFSTAAAGCRPIDTAGGFGTQRHRMEVRHARCIHVWSEFDDQ
jgi:hypothetical protein